MTTTMPEMKPVTGIFHSFLPRNDSSARQEIDFVDVSFSAANFSKKHKMPYFEAVFEPGPDMVRQILGKYLGLCHCIRSPSQVVFSATSQYLTM